MMPTKRTGVFTHRHQHVLISLTRGDSSSINKPAQVKFIIPNLNTPTSVQGPTGPLYLLIQPNSTGSVRKPLQAVPLLNRSPIPNVPPLVRFNMPLPTFRFVQIGTSVEKKEEKKKEDTYQNPFNYKSIEDNMYNASYRLKAVERKLNKKTSFTLFCVICSTKYEDKNELIDHYKMHKNVQDQIEDNINDKEYCISCPVCNITFRNRVTYARHVLQKHGPKEYVCDQCDRVYSNEYYLSLHLAGHEPDRKTYICQVCKVFSTKETPSLWNHIISKHVKEVFHCKECGKNFTSKSWFNDHKIFHINDRNFSCNKCNVQLRNQRHYIDHMKNAHQITVDCNIKNKCFECDLTFPFETNLEKHKLHVHKNPNTFLCNVCGKGFPSNQGFQLHMKVHGDPQYTCSTCGKSFKQMRVLALHRRIHTGEKPNKCNECGKCFTQKSTLNIHLRTHSGERPYPCGKCKKGFITKTIRDNHQKSCKTSHAVSEEIYETGV